MTRQSVGIHGCLALVLAGAGCIIPMAGGCEHTYREPVLILASVRDSVNGRAITRVNLDSASVNGQPIQLTESGLTRGISVVVGAVVCTVSCGFGTGEGRYVVRVTATGYRPRWLTVTARYDEFHGGCPSWNDEGTRVNPRLVPE